MIDVLVKLSEWELFPPETPETTVASILITIRNSHSKIYVFVYKNILRNIFYSWFLSEYRLITKQVNGRQQGLKQSTSIIRAAAAAAATSSSFVGPWRTRTESRSLMSFRFLVSLLLEFFLLSTFLQFFELIGGFFLVALVFALIMAECRSQSWLEEPSVGISAWLCHWSKSLSLHLVDNAFLLQQLDRFPLNIVNNVNKTNISDSLLDAFAGFLTLWASRHLF